MSEPREIKLVEIQSGRWIAVASWSRIHGRGGDSPTDALARLLTALAITAPYFSQAEEAAMDAEEEQSAARVAGEEAT